MEYGIYIAGRVVGVVVPGAVFFRGRRHSDEEQQSQDKGNDQQTW
jgi:TfoX/Sxy family transcriptional regulator of competence genes